MTEGRFSRSASGCTRPPKPDHGEYPPYVLPVPLMQMFGVPLQRPTFDRVTGAALGAVSSLGAWVVIFFLLGWPMDTAEKIQFFAAFSWCALLQSFDVRPSQGPRQAALHMAGYLFLFFAAGFIGPGALLRISG